MCSHSRNPWKRTSGGVFLLILLVLVSGCMSPAQPRQVVTQVPGNEQSWMDMPLSSVQGSGNITIGSFAGKPVIVLIVSDSCPSCISLLSWQIDEIGKLRGVQDKKIVFVALDIDQPGDRGFIEKYHDRFTFTGYSVRSTEEVSLSLLRSLGVFAVDPTTDPVILVCPDGSAVLLSPGPKPAETLEKNLAETC